MAGLLAGTQLVGQRKYPFYSQDGVPGQMAGLGDIISMPYLNVAGHRQQVQTLTPPADVDISEGDQFWISFNGTIITHTVGAGGDTQLAVGLAYYALIRVTPDVKNQFETITVNNTTGVVTLTGIQNNTSYSIVETDAGGVPLGSPDFTVAETVAAGSNTDIGFGLFVGLPTADIGMSAPGLHELESNQAATLMGATTAANFTMFGVTIKPSTLEAKGLFDESVDVFTPGKTMPVLLDIGTRDYIWVQSEEAFAPGDTSLYVNSAGRLTSVATDNFDVSANVVVRKRSSVHNVNIGTPQAITPISLRRFAGV